MNAVIGAYALRAFFLIRRLKKSPPPAPTQTAEDLLKILVEDGAVVINLVSSPQNLMIYSPKGMK